MDNGRHQVPLAEYERHLRQLVTRLAATGAKLIWASTTPVPEGKLNPLRRPADVVPYNAAAEKIMREKNIPIDDLYSFALARLGQIQKPENVHFTDDGSVKLAEQVAAVILTTLGRR
jgi:acyl-CoA thioesterase-1